MRGPDPLPQLTHHLVIVAAFARRLDTLGSEDEILMTAATINVVVFEERRRRQHDIGHPCGFGHELLVHASEQVLARKARLHLVLIGRDGYWIGVLDDQRIDRRPTAKRLAVAGEDGA